MYIYKINGGVPTTAEIIPLEPDTDNAVAGTRFRSYPVFTLRTIKLKQTESMIKISLNDHPLEIVANTSISTLVEITNSPLQGIAVAVNDTVIPRSEWQTHMLQSNDFVLIIKAAQGG